jgi:hypothetical protein
MVLHPAHLHRSLLVRPTSVTVHKDFLSRLERCHSFEHSLSKTTFWTGFIMAQQFIKILSVKNPSSTQQGSKLTASVRLSDFLEIGISQK